MILIGEKKEENLPFSPSLSESFRLISLNSYLDKRYKEEEHTMLDYVHLLLSILPKLNISSFMGYLKEKSTLIVFDEHENLSCKFVNRHF